LPEDILQLKVLDEQLEHYWMYSGGTLISWLEMVLNVKN